MQIEKNNNFFKNTKMNLNIIYVANIKILNLNGNIYDGNIMLINRFNILYYQHFYA